VKVKQFMSNAAEKSSNIRLLTRAAPFAYDPTSEQHPPAQSHNPDGCASMDVSEIASRMTHAPELVDAEIVGVGSVHR
jgi:hypothetical protein